MSTENAKVANLANYHPQATDPLPKLSDVSRFKSAVPSRVVASSQRYVVYTMKDAAKLRVVQQGGAAAAAAAISYDRHTGPVRRIEFMGAKSNVVASCSDNELLVWMIDNGTTATSLVFNAAPVAAFCWTSRADANTPAGLAVTTKTGELIAIPAGQLHQANLTDESGTVQTMPAKEIEIDMGKHQCKVLSKEVGDAVGKLANAVVVEAAPAVVATADASTAILSRGGVSTRWQPGGADAATNAIVDMTVLHAPRPNTVVIATAAALTFWDVSMDEPTELLKVDVPLKVLKVQATSLRLVAVLSNPADAAPTKVQFASINVGQNKKSGVHLNSMTLHDADLDTPFCAQSCVCFSSEKSDDPLVVLDTGNAVSFFALPSRQATRPPKPQHADAAAAAAAPAGPDTSKGSYAAAAGAQQGNLQLPAPHSSAGGAPPPAYQQQQQQHGRNPYGGYGGPQQQQGGNPLVAAGGPGAATAAVEFDRMLEPLHRRLQQNSNRVAGKANDLSAVLPVDHEALLANALDAQRDTILGHVRNAVTKELESFRKSGGGGSSGNSNIALDEESSAQISEVVIRGVSDGIIESVARGISESINAQLARRVDGLVSAATAKQIKRFKRSQEKEGNKQADGVANEILKAAAGELEKKNKDYGMQLLNQLHALNLPATQTLQKMQKTIESQQRFIDKFTQSGLLEEVQRLRDEVATLRAGAGAAAGAASSGSAASKATVLARAKDAIAVGNVDTGLQWVLQQNDGNLTFALLSSIDEDKLGDILEKSATDDSVPAGRWERVATDLTQVVDPQHLPTTLRILQDIVDCERVRKGMRGNSKVVEVLNAYVETWKRSSATLSHEVRTSLRDLAVLLKS